MRLKLLFRYFMICLFLGSVDFLWGGRVIIRQLEGDFEHEFRIAERDGVWRIDSPSKNWTIFYREADRSYTGLEHRDATYWGFQWDAVQKAVQGSKNRFERFSDLNIEGFASYDLTRPTTTSKPVTWSTERVEGEGKWKGTPTKRWKLRQEMQKEFLVETKPDLFLKAFFKKFLEIHQQIRMAVVRPMWSERLDEIIRQFATQEEFPMKIQWGNSESPMYWVIHESQEQLMLPENDFKVPEKYRPSDLKALDGILEK